MPTCIRAGLGVFERQDEPYATQRLYAILDSGERKTLRNHGDEKIWRGNCKMDCVGSLKVKVACLTEMVSDGLGKRTREN